VKAPLLSIFFLFSALISPDPVQVKNDVYQIQYSEDYEQPLRVEYQVKCSHTSPRWYDRTGLDFYTVPGIHTSDSKDYEQNEWDKGHMAPAADFNCDSTLLRTTFSYVNCALQHKDLNRGAWKELEAYEKELAGKGIVNILIELDFTGSKRGAHGALIPAGFKKTIFKNDKPYQAYYFKNEKPTKPWQQYIIKQY
jgi:endonuclease G